MYEWVAPVAACAAFLIVLVGVVLCRKKRQLLSPQSPQKALAVDDVIFEVEEGDESIEELHPYAPRNTTPFNPSGTHYSRPSRPGEWLLLPSQLEQDSGFYTIVLDLDETVVHTKELPPAVAKDVFELYFPDLSESLWSIVRPNARAIFPLLGENAEFVVWTAGSQEYAEMVLANLDPEQNVKYCIGRDQRWFQLPYYTKSLQRLGRNMDWVLLIDNSEFVCSGDSQNCIVVDDFEGDENDTLLFRLQVILWDLMSSNLPVPAFLQQCPHLNFSNGFYRLNS